MVNIQALIGLVIFVLILTALAPAVISGTNTRTCEGSSVADNTSGCALENASASSKSMITLIEILYPVIGVLGIVTVFEIRRRM